jgi:RNA polymerase sigma factor (sigma-70 family)
MSDSSPFLDLLTRLRAGDEPAASDVYVEYEPAIRRQIRARLRNRPLRVADEEDVCLSVMKSFFLRCRLGQYDLNGPEDLCKLLARMAGNKLIDQIRVDKGPCRGGGQIRELLPSDTGPTGRDDTPSMTLSNQELFKKALQSLTPEEREIHTLVSGNELTWAEVAAKLGGTAEGRRKQWERVCDRVTEELGLKA